MTKLKRGFYLIVLPQLSIEHRPPSTDLEVIDAYTLRMIQSKGISDHKAGLLMISDEIGNSDSESSYKTVYRA